MRRKIRRGFIIGTIGYVLVAAVIFATFITLQQRIKTAQSQLTDVNAQLSAAQNSLAKTKTSLEDLQEQYATVAAQKTNADQAFSKSNQDMEELKKQISQARCALAASRSAIQAFHEKEYGAAVTLYDKALACDPDNAYLLNLKAYSLFKEHKLQEAVSTERRSLQADPDYVWGQVDLARFLCASGPNHFQEAKAAINEALRLRPYFLESMREDGELRKLCKGLVP